MSYTKMTIISGFTTRRPKGYETMTIDERVATGWFERAYKSVNLSGHWSREAAARKADAMGLKYNRKCGHHVGDMSGKGRGGMDREFKI